MDIEQKKGEVKADIAKGPENVVFARIDICDEIQLADLMKEDFDSERLFLLNHEMLLGMVIALIYLMQSLFSQSQILLLKQQFFLLEY